MLCSFSIATFVVDLNSDPDPYTTHFIALGIALALLIGIRLLVSKPEPGESLPELFQAKNYLLKVMLPILLITAVVATVALITGQNDFDQIEVDGTQLTFRHSLLGNDVAVPLAGVTGYEIDTEIVSTGEKNSGGRTAFIAAVRLKDGRTLESDPWLRSDTMAAMEKAGIKHLSTAAPALILPTRAK
jgi:hypothetical protein